MAFGRFEGVLRNDLEDDWALKYGGFIGNRNKEILHPTILPYPCYFSASPRY